MASRLRRQVDNLRAALDWALSRRGDVVLGIALTIASIPFWMYLSLVEECRRHVDRALAALAKNDGGEPRQEMKLKAALGSALVHQRGSGPDIAATRTRALAIAEKLGDIEYQLRALSGPSDQAMRVVRTNIEDALAIGHALSLCSALANAACPLSIMTGDLVMAERYVGMLLDHTLRHGLAVWHAWGRCFQGMLLIKRGDSQISLRSLREALDEFPYSGFALRYSAFRTELAESLGRAGEVATALAAIDEALERAERNEERWCISEMLRIKGELEWLRAAPAEVAEALYIESIYWARRQDALSWELRTATSLARLQAELWRAQEARATLETVYGQFTEGFGTSDLITAKTLLNKLDHKNGSFIRPE